MMKGSAKSRIACSLKPPIVMPLIKTSPDKIRQVVKKQVSSSATLKEDELSKTTFYLIIQMIV